MEHDLLHSDSECIVRMQYPMMTYIPLGVQTYTFLLTRIRGKENRRQRKSENVPVVEFIGWPKIPRNIATQRVKHGYILLVKNGLFVWSVCIICTDHTYSNTLSLDYYSNAARFTSSHVSRFIR